MFTSTKVCRTNGHVLLIYCLLTFNLVSIRRVALYKENSFILYKAEPTARLIIVQFHTNHEGKNSWINNFLKGKVWTSFNDVLVPWSQTMQKKKKKKWCVTKYKIENKIIDLDPYFVGKSFQYFSQLNDFKNLIKIVRWHLNIRDVEKPFYRSI